MIVLPKTNHPANPIQPDPRIAALISAAHGAYVMLEALDHNDLLVKQRQELAEALTDVGVNVRRPAYLVLSPEEMENAILHFDRP